MRGSVEAIAVARDVASSSPSKPASALDMMRYQRISPDCLPLANGGGGGIGGSGKQPAPAPRSSKDDDGQAVATDSSRLTSYLATASLEPKLRARALHPPPPAQALAQAPAQATSSAAASATRSPARDHGHHPSDYSDHTSPSPKGTAPDASMLLQWGHNKRSRGRRDASASASSPAPAPAMTPSQVRRQAALKVQRRHAAAEKLMPPPSTRGSNLRVNSSLPSRAAADAQHGRTAAVPHNRSEERAVGQVPPPAAAAASKQQRPASDKAPPHKAEAGVVLATATPEPKRQMGGSGGGGGPHHQAELLHGASPSSKPATGQKHELPRIYTTLSRKEKEEDFLAMKGSKLSQRPKKRPKLVEKGVSYICPGMWLTEVTRSKYEVREKKCTKKQKRRGGLKGMESSDSD